MRNVKYYLLTLCLVIVFLLNAQVKVGDNPTSINTNSMFEIEATDKGLLLPRIALVATNNVSPLAATIPAGMLVYNTATAGIYPNNVSPGLYFWNGTLWVKLEGATSNTWAFNGNSSKIYATNSTDSIVITNTGRLGIGQRSPNVPLEVNGSVRFNAADRSSTYGVRSTAWGDSSVASGLRSTAWGDNSTASGENATAWGSSTSASGRYATSWGLLTNATSENSTAWGIFSTASGENSTAWGLISFANAELSTSWGLGNISESYVQTTLGHYATTETAISTSAINTSDRLFVIGNGTSSSSRTNAVTVMKNGNMGIGTTTLTPKASLEVFGTARFNAADRSSTYGVRSMAWGDSTVASAIRSTAWGSSSLASSEGATAFGLNSIASGNFSTAWGEDVNASGLRSTAWGLTSIASGNTATAWGRNTIASSIRSTAWGENSNATGRNSTVWGTFNTAESYSQTSLGHFATTVTALSASSINSNDRLFVLGNGVDSNNRTNALTVMKNGNIGVGTSTSNPHSGFHNFSSVAVNYSTVSTNTTLSNSDNIVLCTNSASSITVSLPTAVGISGRIYTIKRTSTQDVIIDPAGTETIDGNLTITLTSSTDRASLAIIISDGSNWIRLN
jgi:hypothetical protein